MGIRTYVADLVRGFGATAAAGSSAFGPILPYAVEAEYRDGPAAEDYLRISPAVYMACRYRSQKLASVPLTFQRVGKGGAKTKVTSGSLLELMTKVNPHWTGARLFEMTEMSLLLRGKGFWALDFGEGRARREPKEIWWMHPDRVKVVRGGDYIKGFLYDPGFGEKPIPFAPDEVIWFRYPNPNDEFDGLAPLDAARIVADTGGAALRTNRRMFSQGMQLAGFVAPADKNDQWSKQTSDEIEASLQRRFSGANNAHRWAVLNRQLTFNPLSLSPKDIEFVALLKWSFEDICRVFGLSPDLLGGERTFSNAAEARLAFWQDTMIPETRFFADELTEQLLPLFPGQADVAEFDLSGVDVLQEREDAKWGRWKEQIAAGAKTLNEFRGAQGDKPVPWGDAWWAPVSLVPISTADQAEPPEPVAPPPPTVTVLPPEDPKALPAGEPRSRRRRSIAYGSPEHERAWRAFAARTDRHERLFGAVCADLLRRQRRAVLSRLRDQRGTRDVAEVANDPFDRPKWVKQFRTGAKPVYLEIVKDAGEAALEDLVPGIAFDVADPNVVRFLTQRAQRFAVQVNETTWEALKASLGEGIDAGEGVDALAKRVDAVMGARIRSSAEVISRTETIGAYNGGSLLSWRQSGVVSQKQWLAALDDRTRPSHVEAHEQTVGLDEDFAVGDGSGPHPGAIGLPEEDIQCRCSMVAVLDTEG